MKKILAVIAAFCCAAVMAVPAPKGWLTDYDAALKQAVRGKKSVLVLFTGSDWCPPCQGLRRDTLENAAFRKFASQNLILVYVDIPRGPAPAGPTELKYLSEKLQPGNSVPCTVIVGPDGTVRGRFSGYREPEEYIAEIKKRTK